MDERSGEKEVGMRMDKGQEEGPSDVPREMTLTGGGDKDVGGDGML